MRIWARLFYASLHRDKEAGAATILDHIGPTGTWLEIFVQADPRLGNIGIAAGDRDHIWLEGRVVADKGRLDH